MGLFILGAGGRGAEATVLLWFAKLFTPLSHGEGEAAEWRRGGGAVRIGVKWFLYIYSFSCINIQHGEWIVKPIKLQSESMGFRLRNQGFQDAKPRVLGGENHAFANEKYQF